MTMAAGTAATGGRQLIDGFDLMDPSVHANPYPTYAWLRDHAPVYKSPDAPLYVLSRAEDIERALRDPATFSSDLGMTVPLMSMVMKDPPDHTRLRQTVNRAFTPRNIQHLAVRIETIAEDLVSGLLGPCEFVAAFANPLPVTVISEMLGVPLKHRARMNRFARDALLASFAATGMGSAELRAEAEEGLGHLMAILDEAITAHKAAPKDNIISTLVEDEANGTLSREEMRNLCALLLIAGHETTANLLANGAHRLAHDPALFRKLQADTTLIPAFVEEMVRLKPPLQRLMRRTTRAVEVRDITIPANISVMLLPGSANRDADYWTDGDALDLTRDSKRHVGFGTGTHVCPGASLTRLEARIAFQVLLKRVQDIAPDPHRPPSPIVGYGAGSLGWNQLPLLIEPF
jgi:hypothetical protein